MGMDVEDFKEIEVSQTVKKSFTQLDDILDSGDIRNNRVPGSTMHVHGRRMDLEMMDSENSDNISDFSNTRVERIGTTRNKTIKGGQSSRSGDTESMGQFSMADIDDDGQGSDDSDTMVQKETPSGRAKSQQKSKFNFGAIPEEK